MATLADQIEQIAKDLKETIRMSSDEDLREKLYIVLANMSLLMLSFLKEEGKPGWSRKVVNEIGEPLLGLDESEFLEHQFAEAPWVLTMLRGRQEGGAMPDLKTAGSSLVTSTLPMKPVDFSLDEMFQKLLDKTQQMDEFWNRIAYETPGALRMMNRDIQVPVPGLGPVPVSVRAIAFFLTTLIDSVRLTSALAGQSATGLTILMILQEALTGQWRQMILSAAGLISPTGMAAGVVFKYIVNAWTLIAPDLRTQILRDSYQGTKSLLIGFLLWAVNTFPPTVVKMPIAAALKQITDGVQNVEDQIKELEDQASASLAPLGKRVKFRGLNVSAIAKISLEDIQNLQALARWDLMICTQEFQTIVEEVKKEPILRFLMELIGVPTLAEDKFTVCQQSEPYPSVAEKMMKAMEVSVEDDPDAPKMDLLPQMPAMPTLPTMPTKVGGGHRKKTRSRSSKPQSGRRLTRVKKSRTP